MRLIFTVRSIKKKMGNLKKSLETIEVVIFKRNYLLLTLAVAIALFFILYKLTLATVANQSLNIYIQMSGFNYTFYNLILLGIISILFGIFVSLFVYRVKLIKQNSKLGILGTLGLAAGLFSAGCPTCGSILFAMFGAPLALFYLPLKGLELKILSIFLLLVSDYLLARGMSYSCKIKNERIHKT